jgi:hypothetical protein
VPFADYEREKMKRYDTLVEKQMEQGDSFFRSQEQYQRKRQLELQNTNFLIKQQLEIKERQKFMGAEQSAKENWEVRENRKRQLKAELSEKERSRMNQQDLAYQIKGQMEN